MRQSLATAGSLFGGVIGVIAMILTHQDFHLVFWIAAIPAALGLLILIISVKDAALQKLPKPNYSVTYSLERPATPW